MITKIGGNVFKISRSNITKDTHLSENILDSIEFKYNIDNNGTIKELYQKIDNLL